MSWKLLNRRYTWPSLVFLIHFAGGWFCSRQGWAGETVHVRPPLPDQDEIAKLPRDGGAKYNRLIFEKSPYLLQHAANPVDWYPWGEAVFEKARKEDKPVLLSIGYSTCHWCHVMEHESFENDRIAAFLNEHFVAVKVDREERPDVDQIYMTVCQGMTGSGGWPLTIIMTPDRKPFFAGTYFPPESRFGRPGFLQILEHFAKLWKEKRKDLEGGANQIVQSLNGYWVNRKSEKLAGVEALDAASRHFLQIHDRQNGGFGGAPKFPTPHNYTMLLRQWHRSADKALLQVVTKSLKAMRYGGMYDQIGFGFHRYSTDERFLVPHFEKMLYDQATLTIAYTETYQATRDPFFAQVVREIITYVLRDMTSPAGAFYSAEDADSEGVEGKFYLFTVDDIERILGKEDAALFTRVFSMTKAGNFHDEADGRTSGQNIPHLKRSLKAWADDFNMREGDLSRKLDALRRRVFAEREKRIHPHKDDKVLAAWNGLMIAAMAKAARALHEPAYTEAAVKAADFVRRHMIKKNGRLLRRFRQGASALPAYVDDYAFMVWGLIELYETTYQPEFLDRALELNSRMLSLFWDTENAGLFFSGSDGERLIARSKELYDGAIPSGNSVAALNLVRLARLTGRRRLAQYAEEIILAFSDQLLRQPHAYTQFLLAVDFSAGPSAELVLAGDPESGDLQAMIRVVQERFLPRTVVLLHPNANPGKSAIETLAPLIAAQNPMEGGATAYVCENFSCKAPTSDVREMLSLLEGR